MTLWRVFQHKPITYGEGPLYVPIYLPSRGMFNSVVGLSQMWALAYYQDEWVYDSWPGRNPYHVVYLIDDERGQPTIYGRKTSRRNYDTSEEVAIDWDDDPAHWDTMEVIPLIDGKAILVQTEYVITPLRKYTGKLKFYLLDFDGPSISLVREYQTLWTGGSQNMIRQCGVTYYNGVTRIVMTYRWGTTIDDDHIYSQRFVIFNCYDYTVSDIYGIEDKVEYTYYPYVFDWDNNYDFWYEFTDIGNGVLAVPFWYWARAEDNMYEIAFIDTVNGGVPAETVLPPYIQNPGNKTDGDYFYDIEQIAGCVVPKYSDGSVYVMGLKYEWKWYGPPNNYWQYWGRTCVLNVKPDGTVTVVWIADAKSLEDENYPYCLSYNQNRLVVQYEDYGPDTDDLVLHDVFGDYEILREIDYDYHMFVVPSNTLDDITDKVVAFVPGEGSGHVMQYITYGVSPASWVEDDTGYNAPSAWESAIWDLLAPSTAWGTNPEQHAGIRTRAHSSTKGWDVSGGYVWEGTAHSIGTWGVQITGLTDGQYYVVIPQNVYNENVHAGNYWSTKMRIEYDGSSSTVFGCTSNQRHSGPERNLGDIVPSADLLGPDLESLDAPRIFFKYVAGHTYYVGDGDLPLDWRGDNSGDITYRVYPAAAPDLELAISFDIDETIYLGEQVKITFWDMYFDWEVQYTFRYPKFFFRLVFDDDTYFQAISTAAFGATWNTEIPIEHANKHCSKFVYGYLIDETFANDPEVTAYLIDNVLQYLEFNVPYLYDAVFINNDGSYYKMYSVGNVWSYSPHLRLLGHTLDFYNEDWRIVLR